MPVFAASYHVWRDIFLWTRYSALILREATSTTPAWLQINSYIYESPHNCPDFDLKSDQILITFQNESVRNFFGFWTFASHATAECCAMLYWFLWRLDLLVISKSNWIMFTPGSLISLHTTGDRPGAASFLVAIPILLYLDVFDIFSVITKFWSYELWLSSHRANDDGLI